MKLLRNLLFVALLVVGVLALVPVLSVGFAVLGGLAVFLVWLLPIWIIATSDKTTGMEKCAWILAILCLSWFAWVFYFFLAPLKPKRRHGRYDYDYDY